MEARSGEDEAPEEEAQRQQPVRRRKAGQEQTKEMEGGIPSTQISEKEIKGKSPDTTLVI